jgi:hypothetical protein
MSALSETIWNRACGNGPAAPGAGDTALMAVLTFHGLAMNGGVLYALQCLTAGELDAARAGYRYFGFANAAGVIGAGQAALTQGMDADSLEETLADAYAAILDDGVLMQAFEAQLDTQPADFAPITEP